MHNRRELLKQFGGALACSLAPAVLRAQEKSPVKPRIKIGQIGVGHAHATQALGLSRVARLRGRRARRAGPGRCGGVPKSQPALPRFAVDDPGAVAQHAGLEAVLVETRVRDLLDTAEALCVAAGKHIHLDKPAGESLPQFRRILDAAERQKLLVQMGYMYRYNPAVVLLREFLKKGWLGEPCSKSTR
jgi:predicted dehydrogenase